MLKGNIFLDMENLNRFGGWSIRFEAVKQLVESKGVEIVRANAYMAIDVERERRDEDYKKKKSEYRGVIRRAGFHVKTADTTRAPNPQYEDEWVIKANVDVDMIVDMMTQCKHVDYVLIGSGDGNMAPIVRWLQSQGKRVDLLAFGHPDPIVREEVDNFYSGYLYPEILPPYEDEGERMRGYLHMVNGDKGFGFLTVRSTDEDASDRTDIFLHITDFEEQLDNRAFANLKTNERIVEFTLVESEDGKFQAKEAVVLE